MTTHLLPFVRIIRQLFHFGPWRTLPRYLIRQLRPPRFEPVNDSLLHMLDPETIATELRHHSVAAAGILPAPFVDRLRAITEKLPVGDYQLMHFVDDDIHRLVNDPAIRNVLRAYFRSEPELLESSLVITHPYRGGPLNQQNLFHFDYAGWESLNVFVYLSEMGANSSCHVVARGSHRSIEIGDILRGTLTCEEALRRFGPRIQTIMGPPGTIFFENTEAFHRRLPGNERRAMLNLLYASHRSLLSHGRTSRLHMQNRQKLYDQLKAGENR